MNIEEMLNKITIFYDEKNIIKMVVGGIADSNLYNKIVIDKKDYGIDIKNLMNKKVIIKEGEKPSFSI